MLMGFGAYSSAEIAWAQKVLTVLGFNPGTADGVAGANTRAAALAYQKSRGLAADGIIGPATMTRLRSDYAALTASTGATALAYPSTAAAAPVTIPTVLPAVQPTGYTTPVTPTTVPGAPRKLILGMDLNQIMLYGGLGAVAVGAILFLGLDGSSGGRKRASKKRRR